MSAIPDRIRPFAAFDLRTGDVFALRVVTWDGSDDTPLGTDVKCNVPQEVWLWPDVGYGWGKDAKGGVTLALNILDRFLPPRIGELVDEWHRPLTCSVKAYAFCVAFYHDFLLSMPHWGGRVQGSCIKDWVEAEKQRWELDGLDLGAQVPTDLWPSIIS